MRKCWYCNTELGVDENWFGDINCQKCGVINSFINPAEAKKEEEMGKLKQWAKDNAKYIKISDGESYEGVFEGYKEGVNMNGEPAMIYKLDGKEFKSSSSVLAESFDEISIGSRVLIKRTGEGLQTKWKVEIVG